MSHFRFALFFDPSLGAASYSMRIMEALRARGHAVFAFTPSRFPLLFEGCAVKAECIKRFLEVQDIQACLCADGLWFDRQPALSRRPSLIRVAFGAHDACIAEGAPAPDAAWCFSLQAQKELARVCGPERTQLIAPVFDAGYGRMECANSIALCESVVCIQDATPARISQAESLRNALRTRSLELHCVGKGWPQGFGTHIHACSEAVYATRAAQACVVFSDGEQPDCGVLDVRLAQAVADGVPLVCIGENKLSSYYAEEVTHCPSPEAFLSFLNGSVKPVAQKPESCLEDVLEDAIVSSAQAGAERLAAPESLGQPRVSVCALGYVGFGNFGDELTLALLDRRLRARYANSMLIAVSQNPWDVVLKRGIYALPIVDKKATDAALRDSSAALVLAGLMFDQGMRWSMGKSELLSRGSTANIPSIAGFMLQAFMNDAAGIFYSQGAGPLELQDSRRLVRLMAACDARFFARDPETAELMQACGVAPGRIGTYADSVFLLDEADSPAAKHWAQTAQIDFDEHCVMALSLRNYENLPADFAYRVAGALDAVIAQHDDMRVMLLALDNDDCTVLEAVRSNMQYASHTALFDNFDDLDAVAWLLSHSTCGLAMRLHAAVVMCAAGVPACGIDYLPKVSSLFSMMGLGDLLLNTDATQQDIEAKLTTLLDNRDTRAAEVRHCAERCRHAAQLAEDRLFAEVADHRKEADATPAQLYLYDLTESQIVWDREQSRRIEEAIQHTAEQGSSEQQSATPVKRFSIKGLFGRK